MALSAMTVECERFIYLFIYQLTLTKNKSLKHNHHSTQWCLPCTLEWGWSDQPRMLNHRPIKFSSILKLIQKTTDSVTSTAHPLLLKIS